MNKQKRDEYVKLAVENVEEYLAELFDNAREDARSGEEEFEREWKSIVTEVLDTVRANQEAE